VFTIGHTVSERLARYNGIDSEVLYQASTMRGLQSKQSASGARYFFLPGRLHRWKRVDLAIEAMRHVKAPIELWISGTGEDEPHFRALAQKEPRIRFLGRVSDAELIDLYAGALAVLFVPLQEDFGLVTLEAFLSGRPVITCEDSGEPARIVRHAASGFVVAPRPVELAVAMQTLATAPELSDAFGRQGAEDVLSITWERVGSTLMAALGFQAQIPDRACA
jgi:glycosyltransferase involved in cell wall biosynthesis